MKTSRPEEIKAKTTSQKFTMVMRLMVMPDIYRTSNL